MVSIINTKKPIDIKKRLPRKREEKKGKKKIIIHDKIRFLLLIRLINENNSRGCPATVSPPDGQKGISENAKATAAEISLFLSFAFSKYTTIRYMPINAIKWIKIFKIQ